MRKKSFRSLGLVAVSLVLVSGMGTAPLSCQNKQAASGKGGATPGSRGGGGGVTRPVVPKYVYVTNNGDSTVSQYTVGADGGLSPMSPATVASGSGPVGIAVDPSGRFAYVTNGTNNGSGQSISQYSIGSDGALTPLSAPSVTSSQPGGIAVSPLDGFVYAVSYAGYVNAFSQDADGELSWLASPHADLGSVSIALAPSGKYAYVTNTYAGNATQFTIEADGSLTPMSTPNFGTGGGPKGIVVSPSGNAVYLANEDDHTVSQYSVGSDGSLTPMSTPAVSTGPSFFSWYPIGIAIDPAGKYLYTANNVSTVSQFTVGADGSLSLMSAPTVAAGNNPRAVAVDPSGKYVYVVNQGSSTLSQFTVGADGSLSPMTIATVSTGGTPYGIAVVGGSN